MSQETPFKKIIVVILLISLLIISFILVKPILYSLTLAVIAAYVFSPLYKIVYRKTKAKNISALMITLFAVLIIIIPLTFAFPLIVTQIFDIYSFIQNLDFATLLSAHFPSIFTQEISAQIALSLNSFITKLVNSTITSFSDFLTNLPSILLQAALIIFTFFFVIRDTDKLEDYLSSLSPFSTESHKEFFSKSKDITKAVLYGHFVVGLIQGLVTGLGLLIFGVSNSLTLTFLAIICSVIPVIGPWLVWFPVSLFLIASGNTFAGVGMLIYGLAIVSWIDNIIKPVFVGWKANVHSGLILIGMIGGYLSLGFLGLVIGPLIISYLLLVLDMYRDKKFDNLFFNLK